MKNIRLTFQLLNAESTKKNSLACLIVHERTQSTAREGMPLHLFTEDYGNRFFKLKLIKAIVPEQLIITSVR